ncbi:MAG: PP2C family protein-serine/threonine phosphatase [Bacteroidota bacterium]
MRSQANNVELLERDLYLKQLQINRLLDVTQAINNNLSAETLFKIYKDTLNWELGIKKMALFIKEEDEWICATSIEVPQTDFEVNLEDIFARYKRVSNIDEEEGSFLSQFDIIVPVYHKEYPIAFTLIGDLGANDNTYETIQFVTTISNIISVAIENKRLFKRQLEQERLKKEMELAEQMQKLLIPNDLPANERYELDSIYMPHLGVGGDYFDFFPINEDEFVVCIADISGKGVAAALLMSNFQANMQVNVQRDLGPAALIQELNAAVLRITKGEKFITFFFARVNLKTHTITYVNAGHNPPVLYCSNELVPLDKGCTILGYFDEIPEIEVGQVVLKEEALLMTYTDGLTDIRNPEGNFFETDALYEFVKKYHLLNAKGFNKKLLEQIKEFKREADFPDDVAVLTCKLF